MKKISVFLITLSLIMFGCGNKVEIKEEKREEAILLKDSLWCESEYAAEMNDANERRDYEYMRQLMIEGKVKSVDRDTKVERFGVAANPNNVLILFKEGKYTNKAGCAFAENVYMKKREVADTTGSSKNARVDKKIYASEDRSCTCVLEKGDIDLMIEIGERKSALLLLYDKLIKEGKIILIREETAVACYYADEYRGFVPVIFMEGEYKGRRAYVLSNRLE